MGKQGMELWRPDWPTIYKGTARFSLPDKDNALVTVTRETLRIAKGCIATQMEQDYYHNYGAAYNEILKVLEEKK